jgi:hypothetical protein
MPDHAAHWLSDAETRMLGLVDGKAMQVGTDLRWYASDESYRAFFGPFRSRVEAVRWIEAYSQGL